MEAIKKKMQAMKLEKDNAMDRADACEQQAKGGFHLYLLVFLFVYPGALQYMIFKFDNVRVGKTGTVPNESYHF